MGALSGDGRDRLMVAGFESVGTRHLRWTFTDGSYELVDFPENVLDGGYIRVELDSKTSINVISLGSLVVDRLDQATDRTPVTFDEALRLVAATVDDVDWGAVRRAIDGRGLRVPTIDVARRVLAAAGDAKRAERWFSVGR